ncbi:MAG: molybdate ABC transporter substrate-binding protein [Acidobacteriota bacterium]|nr:molybdate ABC transporter substrate-binding protein [Acidobacteriota bacterium]
MKAIAQSCKYQKLRSNAINRRQSLLISVLALLFIVIPVRAEELAVAAAADLKFAMADVAAQFEKQTGNKVNVTYGSSGNFFSQLQNGAPFDLFFSADIDYARRLESAGLIEPGSLYMYAIGRIALWAATDSNLDLGLGWKVLLDDRVQKIAIANPDHAPYGRAAIAAMKKAGVYDQGKSKLVFGDNISQAAQFAQSGNAQVGIVALSLAISPGMRNGKRWDIPANMHPPIEQAAVLIKNAKNKQGARAFLDFVKTDAARATLAKHGFTFPAVKGGGAK